jgi:cell wall-associated NlpC family hydrolase
MAKKTFGTAGLAVVTWARTQIGKKYLFAGVGPDAYDCSGLVLTAWKQQGVAMPHNSGQQAKIALNPAVTTVPATFLNKLKLQPGDLVFYYAGISHVGLYSGLGKGRRRRFVVQATDENHGVEEIWMFRHRGVPLEGP